MEYDDLRFRARQVKLQINEQGPAAYSDLLEEIENQTPTARPRPSFAETSTAFAIREVPFIDDLVFEQAKKMPLMRGRSFRPSWDIKNDELFKTLSDEDKRQFVGAETPEELRLLHRQATRMRWAKGIMEESSFSANLGAALVTAPLDITTWIEVAVGAGFLKVAKLGSLVSKANKARNIALLAAEAGGSATLAATGREAILLSDQQERTAQEAFYNVVAEGVFGAVLGGGAGAAKSALASRAAREATGAVDRLAEGRKVSERASEILMGKKITDPTGDQLAGALEKALIERNDGFRVGDSSGVKGGLSTGVGWVMKNIFRTPFHRTALSDFEVARVWSATFSDIPVARTGVPDDLIMAALDTVKQQMTGDTLTVIPRLVTLWKEGAGDLSRSDYMKYVGKASSYSDDISKLSVGSTLTGSQIESINAGSRELRAQLGKIHELGVSVGAWGRNAELGQTAETYFTRVWDTDLANNRDDRLKFLIEAWAEKTNSDRRAAAEEIGETFTGEMTQLDVDAAVSNIRGGRGSVVEGKKGGGSPTKARAFDIPNNFQAEMPDGTVVSVNEFLNNDAEHVLEHNVHFVLPRLLLAERFGTQGSKRMVKIRAQVDELMDRMRGTDDPAEYQQLLSKLDEANVRAHVAETASLFEEAGGGELKSRIAAYEKYGDDVVKIRRSLFDAETEHRSLTQQLEVARGSATKAARAQMDSAMAGEALDGPIKQAGGVDGVLLDFLRTKNEIAGLRKGLASKKKLMRPWEDRAEFEATGDKSSTRGVGEELDPQDWTRSSALMKAEAIRERVGAKQVQAQDRAVNMQRVFNSLSAERGEKASAIRAKGMSAEKTSNAIAKLDDELELVSGAMRTGHARFRNVKQIKLDPGSWAANVEETFLDLNHMRLMGGVTISSIPDLATSVMWLGMRDWFGGTVAHISSEMDRLIKRSSKDELGAMFNGMEVVNSYARQSLMSGLDSPNVRAGNGVVSRTRRSLRKGFNSAIRINWWNEQAKRMVATQVQHKTIRLLRKGSIDAKETAFLKRFGVSESTFGVWRTEVAKHGQRVKEGRTLFELANVEAWDSKAAGDAYKQFLTAVANNSVVTLGSLDLPKAFDSPGWRSIVQFKSFGVATLNRVTGAGLSASDSHFAQASIGILAMGYMASRLKDAISGRDTSEDTARDQFMNALDRSGLLGSIMDVDNIIDRTSGGLVGLRPLAGASSAGSRYSSRSKADAFLGPSIGLLEDLAGVAGSALRGVDGEKEFSQSDIARVRRSLPYQNLFYLRVLFDRIAAPNINEGSNKIEKALGARLGLPERTR